jgi:hypothetical protein
VLCILSGWGYNELTVAALCDQSTLEGKSDCGDTLFGNQDLTVKQFGKSNLFLVYHESRSMTGIFVAMQSLAARFSWLSVRGMLLAP